MEALKIDPEFQGKIPPLTEAEYEQLKENILTAGEVYEPIKVWNGIIVDGHNRWRIIQENPGISYRVQQMNFSDKWAAFEWMYKNQLGRRNLTEQQREMIIGQMYEAARKTHGNHAERGKDGRYLSPQNEGLGEKTSPTNRHASKTAVRVATELGVGRASVERAANFKEGIDAMKDMGDDGKAAADKILSGKAGVTKRTVRDFSKMKPEQQEQIVKSINEGKPADPPKPKQEEAKSEPQPKKQPSQKELIAAAIASLKGQGEERTTKSDEDRFLHGLQANTDHAVAIIRREIEQNKGVLTNRHTKDEARAIINKAIDSLRKLKTEM